MSVLPINSFNNNLPMQTQNYAQEMQQQNFAASTAISALLPKEDKGENAGVVTNPHIESAPNNDTLLENTRIVQRQTHAYRKHLISQIIDASVSVLNKIINEEPNSPTTVRLFVKAKKTLEESWNFISMGDEKEAYVVDAVDSILTPSFRKTYTIEQMEMIRSLLEDYDVYDMNSLQNLVISLFKATETSVIPVVED